MEFVSRIPIARLGTCTSLARASWRRRMYLAAIGRMDLSGYVKRLDVRIARPWAHSGARSIHGVQWYAHRPGFG